MLTIATFNLCNLGAGASPTRFARLGAIIVQELGTPTILALQEIVAESPELAGGRVPADAAYQALIAAILDAVFLDRGNAGPEDSTGIRFSGGSPSLTLNPGRIVPGHPAFAGDNRHHWAPSRKALAAEFAVQGRRLFVIVCHFKSMRSITRREEDYAKKQRHAQAQVVHHFAADLLACDPRSAIVILGDLNDLPGSKTLKLLKGEWFHNLLDDQPCGQGYTRRHGGQPQALDHILVSPALRHGATARIPHVNSDAAPGEPEPASDHDPVVASLPAFAEMDYG